MKYELIPYVVMQKSVFINRTATQIRSTIQAHPQRSIVLKLFSIAVGRRIIGRRHLGAFHTLFIFDGCLFKLSA